MAQTTKNNNSKAKTTQKPAAAAKKPAAKKPAAKKVTQKQAAEQLAQRRCILAAVLLVVSFVGFLNMFHTGGFLIRWYRGAFYWLLGWGAEILPLTLMVCGILLLVKRRKKVRLQAAAWGVLPLLFGGVRHLLATHNDYYAALDSFWQMGKDGQALRSGGVLAGGLAELLRAALSTAGGAVMLVVLLMGCFLLGCHLTPVRLRAIFGKVKPISEKELPPEPEKEESLPLRRDPARLKHDPKAIDVALDDESVQVRRPDKQKESPLPPPNVQTPAEALRGIFHKDKKPDIQVMPDEGEFPQPEPEEERPPVVVDMTGFAPESTEPAEMEPVDDLPPWETADQPAEMEPTDEPAADEEPVEVQIQKAMEMGEGAPIYLYPPIRLLKPGPGKPAGSAEAIQRCAERLVDTLQSFGVEATVIDTTNGPSVTRYELQLQRGIKFSKVVNLADDIALALGAAGIRVSAIPDKNAVGIEVPNEVQELVTARDIIGHPAFQNAKSKLSFAIGKDITGAPVVGDIAKMPHMLIAGTTGSGKSVCINSILMSILYKASPEEVRLIMVDPKMIELGVYNGIPHLLIPVVTDPKKAAGALNWAVTEMMRRYKLFSEIGARNLAAYNAEIARDPESENEPLPQVVIVIDELADLMAVAKSEVENAIIRLAQMARAAGMHLIIATQRPSADVITGLMKDNIPSRIAFAVASAINSRIILDQSGAEKLLGKGDMLFNPLGLNKPQRIQGCFVSDSEVEEVVAFVKQCGQPEYNQEILDHMERSVQAAEEGGGGAAGGDVDDEDDPVFDEAVEIVVSSGQASVSMLQRRLKLGYSRAARLVDQMEERGIVGPFEGSKPRAVLITKSDWQERMARKRDL